MDYPTTVSKTELGPFMLLTIKIIILCEKKLFSVSLTLAEQGLTRKIYTHIKECQPGDKGVSRGNYPSGV